MYPLPAWRRSAPVAASAAVVPCGVMDLVLLSSMFVLLPIISSSQSACPSTCTCDLQRHLVGCQNAALGHLPWNLPVPMELASLDLSHNQISEINAQIVYPNLKYLDLSANNILDISENILRDLPNLEVLYLKGNRLSGLRRDVFDGMLELRHLDLSDNQLTDINVPLFEDLASLEELNLAGNLIHNLTGTAFQNLDSLRYLNLEDNQIRIVQPDAFAGLPALKSLNLGYNDIHTLPLGAFSQLNFLRELDLQANNLRDLSVEVFVGLRTTSSVSRLEKLDLRNNLLQGVPSGALAELANLETLELSQNPISRVTSGAFVSLEHLRVLHLNTMPVLTSVHENSFMNLGNLLELQMHSNHKLSQIELGAFQGIPQLRKLDLHANALQSLSSELLDWRDLQLLDLRYNPWHCDCHLAWLPRILKEQATNTTTYITQEVKCASPDKLQQTLVIAMENPAECLNELVTMPMKADKFQDHIMIAIMCSVGGVLLVVIVVLMCKYGKAYRTAYAPAMDQYVYRNPSKDADSDVECQRVPVIEGDMTMARNLRSSLSSTSGIGAPGNAPKGERRLYRVRFAEANACTEKS